MCFLKNYPLLLSFFILTLGSTCNLGGEGGFNLFSPEKDVELGRQVAREIENNPDKYPVLPVQGNEELYTYVEGIAQRILNSGEVAYREEFVWQIRIIDDDEQVNAFAAPGGFIYVYTGLMKFLEAEDQFAGVLGHEIAHAALRHATEQMSKIYGVSALVAVISGEAETGLLEDIALNLLSLQFSRANEREADEYSVIYLCGTDYHPDASADFFRKTEDQPQPPTFLSTHPSPENRVQNIVEKGQGLSCGAGEEFEDRYQRMLQLIE